MNPVPSTCLFQPLRYHVYDMCVYTCACVFQRSVILIALEIVLKFIFPTYL